MNLLLYVESRQTLAQLRAEANANRGRSMPARNCLSYPDDIYAELGYAAGDMPSAFQSSIDELFDWQPAHPSTAPQPVAAYR